MEAGPVAADGHQAGEGHHQEPGADDALGEVRPHRADPVQGQAAAPDGAAQQAGAVGDQGVLEVGDHHVVAPLGGGGVEGQQAGLAAEGVGEAFEGALPAAPQLGGGEGAVPPVGERRLAGEGEAGVDDPADVAGGDAEAADAVVELAAEAEGVVAGVAGAQVPFGLELLGGGAGLRGGVEEDGAAEHAGLDGRRDHGVDRSQVAPFGGDLGGHPGEVLQVGGVGAGRGVLPAGAHEVDDLHLAGLTDAVDAPDALLEAVGVEGDVVVDDPVAVVLQVDALAGGVGGQEDAQRVAAGMGLEGVLDALPAVVVRAAVDDADALASQAPGEEDGLQPVEGGDVLGEDDHPLVVPLPAGPAYLFQFGHQGQGLAVGPLGVAVAPRPHLGQVSRLVPLGLVEQVGGADEEVGFAGVEVVAGGGAGVVGGPLQGVGQPGGDGVCAAFVAAFVAGKVCWRSG